MSQIPPVTGGSPPVSEMAERLTINPGDSKELQAVKLKARATYESQYLNSSFSGINVLQQGAIHMGVPS
jgi:hypothetical protein